MFLLIVMDIKAYYLNVEPLGKRIVSWYQFGTMFGTLGKLSAEIINFVGVLN